MGMENYDMTQTESQLAAMRKYRKTPKGRKAALRYNNSRKTPKERKKTNIRTKRVKQELYTLMGNKCVCCGENDPIYFNIDHVYNDGHLTRGIKLDVTRTKGTFYNQRVTKRIYLENPKRFQILCSNCNHAKKLNGGKLYKPKNKRKAA